MDRVHTTANPFAPSKVDVTFVIVAYRNDPSELVDLASSLLQNSESVVDEVECVVVINDDSIVNVPPNIKLVQGHGNIGFAAGVALGVEHARGQKTVIVNPDCGIDHENLSLFLSAMQVDSGIVTPMLYNDFGQLDYTPFENWVYTPGRKFAELRCWFYLRHSKADGIPSFVKIPGTFIGLDTQLARNLDGPFDSQFFLYGEDRDLTNRAKRKKVKMTLLRDVKVRHTGGESGKGISTLVERCKADSTLRIALRRYGRFGAAIAALDLVLVAYVKKVLTGQDLLLPRTWAIKRWFVSRFHDPGPLSERTLK